MLPRLCISTTHFSLFKLVAVNLAFHFRVFPRFIETNMDKQKHMRSKLKDIGIRNVPVGIYMLYKCVSYSSHARPLRPPEWKKKEEVTSEFRDELLNEWKDVSKRTGGSDQVVNSVSVDTAILSTSMHETCNMVSQSNYYYALRGSSQCSNNGIIDTPSVRYCWSCMEDPTFEGDMR